MGGAESDVILTGAGVNTLNTKQAGIQQVQFFFPTQGSHNSSSFGGAEESWKFESVEMFGERLELEWAGWKNGDTRTHTQKERQLSCLRAVANI